MKPKYTKKQIEESIKHWQKILESQLDLDDDIEMSSLHDVAQADQNLEGFASIFSGDVTLESPGIELVAKALYKCIDVKKLKDHIAMLKRLSISSKPFQDAIHSLESLAYFLKCMDEFHSKIGLDNFKDDVY